MGGAVDKVTGPLASIDFEQVRTPLPPLPHSVGAQRPVLCCATAVPLEARLHPCPHSRHPRMPQLKIENGTLLEQAETRAEELARLRKKTASAVQVRERRAGDGHRE